jgi:3-methyladenine DNA glycosylase AlkD
MPPSDLSSAIQWLKAHGTKAHRDGLARFAIPTDRALGVTMGNIQELAKQLGRDHALAQVLWESEWLEARMLAAYVDDPKDVTAAQMDRWCLGFDNWAVCDTVCFALFDRTPHAWRKVTQWVGRKGEFEKRAAFAVLWGLTVHDKAAGDEPFLNGLALIERAATDERPYVKKAVNMALRATGKRNAALRKAALAVSLRLAASDDATSRWVGKDALRELNSASVIRRVTAKPKV